MHVVARQAVLALTFAAFCFLVGCQPGGQSATNSAEATAKVRLSQEIDKWVAGQKSKAVTWRLAGKGHPLSYRIRNVAPGNALLGVHPTVEMMKEDPPPAFHIIVDVDFKSEAGTVLTQVAEYNVVWLKDKNDWSIDEWP